MADTGPVQGRYRPWTGPDAGEMGEVWRAPDASPGRRVAVTCLEPLGSRHARSFTGELRERLRR